MRKITKRLKNGFIPSLDNDYKPRVLGPRIIAFVCMVAVVGELAFVFGSTYLIPRSKLYGIVEASALVDETNQNRSANNLPTLQLNALLQAAAQEKANDMATKGYFAHTSPQGLTPWYWFQNVGYDFDYAGENLAVNFTDSQDVTNAWMNSPEHRANILDTDFTQVGIATAQGVYEGKSATYVVEEFGTPAPAASPVAFVDTAAAASAPTTAPIPAVPVTTPKKTTTKKPIVATITKPTTSTVPVVPTIVAIQNSTGTASGSAQTFVAVKGVQAQSNNIPAAAATIAAQPTVQSSWIQRVFSNPKALADDFYLFLMILFVIASGLNFFIKIRVQYPTLIASGLVVIILCGLCITLNQNIGLLHAAIL